MDEFVWIFNTSETKTGRSSILGGNYIIYSILHTIAILLIIISQLSNLYVITSVIKKARYTKHDFDFSLRFPIYIAVSDIIWGTTHLIDHIYLIDLGQCPEMSLIWKIRACLILNWLGYQQLMYAGLATCMYLKVCRNIRIELGRYEWKLNCFSFMFPGVLAVGSYFTEGFGCSGYWVHINLHSTSGLLLGIMITLIGAFLCVASSFSYLSMRRKVNEMNMWRRQSATFTYHGCNTIAIQCLTTHIYISFCIYCPLAIGYFAYVIETRVFGIIETFTVALIICSANSCGWTNALGYFYNQRVRDRGKQDLLANSNSSTGTRNNISLARYSNSNNVSRDTSIFSWRDSKFRY